MKDDIGIPETLAAIRLPSSTLGDELSMSLKAHGSDLKEAAIFHCARLTEGCLQVACQQHDMALGRGDRNPYGQIKELSAAQLMPAPVASAAHALRRMGNEVRHLNRPPQPSEDMVCLVFAGFLSEWLQASIRRNGSRTPPPESAIRFGDWDEPIRNALLTNNGQHLLAIAASIEEVLDQAPILSTTLIERAIDLGAWRMAEELLRRARARSFYNQRIIEMEALLHSRQGNPEKAIQLLRPKKYSGRSHQHEAKGILAGAYKRVWQQSGDAGQLKKAAELYAEAWKRSEQTDTYCGINSAACSLWMGDADNATRIAAQVEKTLARQSSHWQKSNGDVGTWHFYDLATMAEALLIQQKPEHADWERDTLLAAKTQGAPLAVFQGQMQRHRETLGMD